MLLPPKKPVFPWRFVVYMLVIAYFIFDLFLFKGPLHKKIHLKRSTMALDNTIEGLAATVNAHPITETELQESIRIYCHIRDIDPDTLPPKRREAIRALVLNERIEDIMMWMYSRLLAIEVPEENYEADFATFRKQFQTEEDFQKRLKSQGFTEETLRLWLRSQTHQRAWIDSKIAEATAVSDTEARLWYETTQEQGRIPEVLRARHIFLATLDQDPAAVKAAITAIHQKLITGDDFAALAKAHSEDERTKSSGGDLNYFTEKRMPADFFSAVSSLELNTISEPFQTKLGWHIAQLTERKPPRRATFEELKPEVIAMLRSNKRTLALPQLIASYRQRANIHIFKRSTPQ
jgi:hypothetical protein